MLQGTVHQHTFSVYFLTTVPIHDMKLKSWNISNFWKFFLDILDYKCHGSCWSITKNRIFFMLWGVFHTEWSFIYLCPEKKEIYSTILLLSELSVLKPKVIFYKRVVIPKVAVFSLLWNFCLGFGRWKNSMSHFYIKYFLVSVFCLESQLRHWSKVAWRHNDWLIYLVFHILSI